MITIEYNDDDDGCDDGCDDERKLHVFVFECDITITIRGQVVVITDFHRKFNRNVNLKFLTGF